MLTTPAATRRDLLHNHAIPLYASQRRRWQGGSNAGRQEETSRGHGNLGESRSSGGLADLDVQNDQRFWFSLGSFTAGKCDVANFPVDNFTSRTIIRSP